MQVDFKSNKAEALARAKKTTRDALNIVGDQVVGWAQDLTPVDTGNLKSSLTHEAESNNVEIVGASNSKAPIKDVNYAIYVELGTVKMHAQPYLRPAIESNLNAIRKTIEGVFADAFSNS